MTARLEFTDEIRVAKKLRGIANEADMTSRGSASS